MPYKGPERRARRANSTFMAWLALLLTLLGAAFALYGRFVALEARMDESDVDRHTMMQTLERIERMLLGERGRP